MYVLNKYLVSWTRWNYC